MESRGGKSEKIHDTFEWWEKLRTQVRLLRSVLLTSAPEEKLESDLREIISNALQQYCTSSAAISTTEDALSVISSKNSSSLEAAFMWLGGWRPTSAIVLVFSIMNFENKKESVGFPELHRHVLALSERQLYTMKSLQAHMRQAEHDLSNQLALLQMLVADQNTITAINAKNWSKTRAAVEGKIADLRDLLVEADNLRLQTLHELSTVLDPVQAAKCIVAAFEPGYAIKTLKGSLSKGNVRFDGMIEKTCLSEEDLLKDRETSRFQAKGSNISGIGCRGSIDKHESFQKVSATDIFCLESDAKSVSATYEQLEGCGGDPANVQNPETLNHFAGIEGTC